MTAPARTLNEVARPLARRAVPAPLRRPLRLARTSLLGQWRRSIQLRVVAATVVLGILVVLVVGQLLLQRITSGIIASRQEAVVAQSAHDLNQAKSDLISGDRETSIRDVANYLAGPSD